MQSLHYPFTYETAPRLDGQPWGGVIRQGEPISGQV